MCVAPFRVEFLMLLLVALIIKLCLKTRGAGADFRCNAGAVMAVCSTQCSSAYDLLRLVILCS